MVALPAVLLSLKRRLPMLLVMVALPAVLVLLKFRLKGASNNWLPFRAV